MNTAPRYYTAFVEGPDQGRYRLPLRLEGMHCAGCMARIERRLKEFSGITQARVNFSTQRLMLEWTGSRDQADLMAEALITMGYTPHVIAANKNMANQKSEEQKLLWSLAVAGFAAGNIMLLSLGLWITDTATMGPAMRDFLHFISAMIAIPAVAVAGQPFFTSAWNALKYGRTNMDVPISVGLILTLTMSLFELLHSSEHAYFDSAVMLMFFLLIGRYLDARVRSRARGAAQDLLNYLHHTATILEKGRPTIIPAQDVQPGMTMMVAVGDRIAADGTILNGISTLDISMVTGESTPHPVGPGDMVMSGTLNQTAPLTIRAQKTCGDSFLAQIVKLLEAAEQGQAHYTRLADRAARLYTPVVHILAIATFLGWTLLGGMAWQPALLIAATVLIITCPCALGLAVPVVQVLATSRLMKSGIMVKSGDALERLATIDTAVFDKTGTVTMGEPVLMNRDQIQPDDLRLAAHLAMKSSHPLARAVTSAYTGPVSDWAVTEHIGDGLEWVTPEGLVRLGRPAWVMGQMVDPEGPSCLMLKTPDHRFVSFIFDDTVRADAHSTIQNMKAHGIKTYLLSGDTPARAALVGQALSFDVTLGGANPQSKYDHLEHLKDQGHHVLMVGDGLNDAPVLARATVSMSPSTAMALTQNVADIVWTGKGLAPVYQTWQVARRATTLIRQNFALSILYNVLAIPLAIMGHVTPLVAALAMSGSSVVVILNSYRWGRP